MRLLIDSHALIWYVDRDHLLSPASHAAITDPSNDLLLSAGSIWEIAIKVGLGKLLLSIPYKLWMTRAISDLGIAILSITLDHADVQAGLPRHHGDPFDRLLIAQAMVEQVSIISGDATWICTASRESGERRMHYVVIDLECSIRGKMQDATPISRYHEDHKPNNVTFEFLVWNKINNKVTSEQ